MNALRTKREQILLDFMCYKH